MAKSKQSEKNEQVQQEQTQDVEKLNRKQCADRVVKDWLASNNGDSTIDELSQRADKLFMDGHEDADPNVDLASWNVQVVLEQLESVGLVALEWHCAVSPKGRLNGGK